MTDTVWGDILRVDLSTGKIKREPLSQELKLNFIGGRGINSKLLYDEVKPRVDPMSPQNALIFGTGPLTGTNSPSCGRWTVTAKSPQTGILGDGNAGGHWAAELKYAGIQHIVISGKADKPVYLSIDDDKVEIRDAAHLWGKDCWEAQQIIKEEWRDPRIQVTVIGQAGENLVKHACILNSITKAAGRTGTGAVMGFKNLKAIAVRGTKGLKIARPEEFKKAVLEARKVIMSHPRYKEFQEHGTLGLADLTYDNAELGAYNHRSARIENCPYIGGGRSKKVSSEYTVKHRACFSCPMGCIHRYVVPDGPYAGTFGDGPELSHQSCVGMTCGITYYPALLRMCTITNWYGICPVSLGSTMGFAMDLYDRGIITKEDTDGIELAFGNHEALLEMTRKISFREGFGNVLAEGTRAVAKKYGKEAEKIAWHIKGLEFTSGCMRSMPGAALSYCTSTRGADHLRGYPTCEPQGVVNTEVIKERFGTTELPPRLSYEGKPQLVVWQQHFNAIQDIVTSCRFTGEWMLAQGLQPRHYAAILSAATGIDFSDDDLMKVGERVYNVERAFNCMEGITRADDEMPRLVYEEPLADGPFKGAILDWDKFEKMKDEYYELRGWDVKTGIPAREKLEELGLKYVADDLGKTLKGKLYVT